MSNQLKDILEDGFDRLESLAKKRKHILQRAEELAGKASEKQVDMAEQQMAEMESVVLSDMNRQSQKIQIELNSSLEGILNREKEYVKNSISNMAARMKAALAELRQSQKNLEHNALDMLSSCFAELNVESNFSREILDSEVELYLSELNALCLEHKGLLKSAELETKQMIAIESDRSVDELNKLLRAIAQDIQSKSKEANESIIESNKQQDAKWQSLREKHSKTISQLLKEEFERIREQISEEQSAINKSQQQLLNSSSERVLRSARQMDEQLEKEFAGTYNGVLLQLNELKQLNTRLLEEQKCSLLDLDSDVKRQVYRVYFDLITLSEKPPHERSNLDKALAELSTELTLVADDLRIRWNEIRKAQEEQIKALSQSASKSLVLAITDCKTKITALLEQDEEQCERQEDELLREMSNLEKKIKRKISMQSDSSGDAAS